MPTNSKFKDQKYYFINASKKAYLQKFHTRPCKLDALAKYAPHPNLFLYHESFARTKFRIPKESFLLPLITIPSTTATSTTSIQMYDNADSTSATRAPVNTFQRQIQDNISMRPASPRIDDHKSPHKQVEIVKPNIKDYHEFPISSHMQVELVISSNPATIAPVNMQLRDELAVPNHLNPDILFDGWETNSVKAMVFAMMTKSPQDDLSYSLEESLEVSHIDTCSDLANSTSMSSYLSTRIENRIRTWLQDLIEQSPTIVECHDNEWDSTSLE